MSNEADPPVAVAPPNNGSVTRRVKLTLVLAVLGCGIGALAFIAARSGTEFYVTPSEITATGKAGVDYRLGGRIVPGSIEWDAEHTFVRFVVTDADDTEAYGIRPNAPTVPVVYDGVVPDLFEERAFVVLGGRYSSSAGFAASSLIIKHESEFIKERERSLEQ